MTADMPDPVEEIAAIIRDYSSKPYTVEASRNAARAILGARAMQDAMAGRVAKVGAYDPERDLEPCLEARLFVTPESLDAFMEANPLPPEPTPSPDVPGLVERLRSTVFAEPGESQRLRLVAEEAADALEALQAEVATQKARADDMHRRAQQAEAPKMAARDVANKMWNFVWKAGERYHKARARATAAEAERDALKAEVDTIKQNLRFPTMLRKMWSGGEVQAWIDEAIGVAKAQCRMLSGVLSACDWPEGVTFGFQDAPGEHEPCYVIMPDGGMIVFNHHAGEGVDIARARFVQSACNAALSPAKAGG